MTRRRIQLTALAFVLGVFFLSALGYGATWNIDPAHSVAHFKIKHMMITNVPGQFTGISGTFEVDDKDITKLKAEATLDVKTLNTNNEKRDGHLKSPDFFDAEKYPTITFKSKKVTKSGANFKLMGDLTMHGVTKEVTLNAAELTSPVKDPGGNMKRGFSATTQLNRKDFGITWNKALEAGGWLVGEKVDVTIELELAAASKTTAG